MRTLEKADRRILVGLGIVPLLAAALVISLLTAEPEAASIVIPPEERRAAADPSPASSPAIAPTAPSAPAIEGLRLHGVTGSGAIIGLPDRRQRLVLLGREVLPGLTLQAVRSDNVLLSSGGGEVELGFSGPVVREEELPQPAGGTSPLPAQAEDRREETLRYRFGLEPRRSDGRITGYTIRRGADLPVLARAGLQHGDVLISVNGQSFDSQEKVQELASEIAGSFTAEFEFERAGRRMTSKLEVNSRD